MVVKAQRVALVLSCCGIAVAASSVSDQSRAADRPLRANAASLRASFPNISALTRSVVSIATAADAKAGIEVWSESVRTRDMVLLPREPQVIPTAGRSVQDVLAEVMRRWEASYFQQKPRLVERKADMIHVSSFAGRLTPLDDQVSMSGVGTVTIREGLNQVLNSLIPGSGDIPRLRGSLGSEDRTTVGDREVTLQLGEVRNLRDYLDILVSAAEADGWIATYRDASASRAGLSVCIAMRPALYCSSLADGQDERERDE